MIGTEQHPEYENLEKLNLDGQFNFLQLLVTTAVNLDRKFLSQTIIKALNFHAIARQYQVSLIGREFQIATMLENFLMKKATILRQLPLKAGQLNGN